MSYTHLNVPQRSHEWHMARLGHATASHANEIQAKGKNGQEAVTRKHYRMQLITERMVGTPVEENDWITPAMQRGIDLEPEALAAYEAETGVIAFACGFFRSNIILQAGASPDRAAWKGIGLIGMKCPHSTTHVKWMREARLPPEHLNQAVHEMLVVDTAQWFDFCSYDNRLPDGLRFFRVRVERRELAQEIDDYRLELLAFLDDVEREYQQLDKMRARNLKLRSAA
jgi:hypothetical protein